MAFAIDGQKHFIHIPFVPGAGPTATQPIGIILPELAAPLTDGLLRDNDATDEQQLFDIPGAQAKTIIKPHAVANDFSGKAVILISLRGGGRGHIWLPIWVSTSD
jgi:hypothetical protein